MFIFAQQAAGVLAFSLPAEQVSRNNLSTDLSSWSMEAELSTAARTFFFGAFFGAWRGGIDVCVWLCVFHICVS